MIRYENCKSVEMDSVFQAFKMGFSDYIIKLEMSKEDFTKRFFGPEGNSLEYSFIAFDQEVPIGLILGGIKNYEGLKTIRCGTMCIHPEYRGQGISQELFERHKRLAKEEGCKQLFLEVIVGNDRAINFYKSRGYEKIYDINYYTYKMPEVLQGPVVSDAYGSGEPLNVTELSFADISRLSDELNGTHINWQNSFDYIEKVDNIFHYGIFNGKELIAGISIDGNGKIFFLWTKSSERNKSIADGMLRAIQYKMGINALSISCTNNANLAGFLKKYGFVKGEIAQYEMYLWI